MAWEFITGLPWRHQVSLLLVTQLAHKAYYMVYWYYCRCRRGEKSTQVSINVFQYQGNGDHLLLSVIRALHLNPSAYCTDRLFLFLSVITDKEPQGPPHSRVNSPTIQSFQAVGYLQNSQTGNAFALTLLFYPIYMPLRRKGSVSVTWNAVWAEMNCSQKGINSVV